jgi:hypothetical protein
MGGRTVSQLRKNSDLIKKNSELTLKILGSMQAEFEKLRNTIHERDKLIHYQELAGIMAAIVSEAPSLSLDVSERVRARQENSSTLVSRKHINDGRDILRKLGWEVTFRNGETRPPKPPKDFMTGKQ